MTFTQRVGSTLHTTLGYVLSYSVLALIFAVVYYILNDLVGHTLVRKAMSPSATPREQNALRQQIATSSAVRKIYEEEKLAAELGQRKITLPVDEGASLSQYEYYSFEFQVMNSFLTQVGIGGVFNHLSDTERIAVILQALSVLVFAAVLAASKS